MTTPATPATTAALSQTSKHTRAGTDALALTLDPVDAGDFLAEYWERQPLVVARGESRRFDGLLTARDVERLVCNTGIRVPAFRLVKEGAQVPLGTYTEDIRWRPGSFTGTAVVHRAADEFTRGATIVLQALHIHWPAAALYCRDLEKRLGCPVQANAYHTPPSARGFAVHHDTHDVFVLQLAGRKRWRVYEPVLELPLKEQRWSPELGDPGEPIDDFTLEAGDTLYLPRGWPHEATTSDEESLHLTVGMHPQTRLDVLRMVLDSCDDDVEFRRSMHADGELPDDLLERLAARLAPDELARRVRRRFVENRRPILHDQLSQLRALEHLTMDDPLERRATVIFELEATDDGGALLLFEGKEIRFPPQAGDAVVAAGERSGPFSAADLPGPLDDEGRLVLVRRLVREGFLRFA